MATNINVQITLNQDDINGQFSIDYGNNTILLLDADTPMETVNSIFDGVCKAFNLGMEFSSLAKNVGAQNIHLSMS